MNKKPLLDYDHSIGRAILIFIIIPAIVYFMYTHNLISGFKGAGLVQMFMAMYLLIMKLVWILFVLSIVWSILSRIFSKLSGALHYVGRVIWTWINRMIGRY